MKKILFAMLSLSGYSLSGQVGIGTASPDNNAILEVSSTDKGLLLPRVALTAMNTTTPLSAHVAGMVVYNTATAGSGENRVLPGMYYNNGQAWLRMTTQTLRIGDVKNGFQTNDHNGWYVLNGRAVSTLPERARNNAIGLGYETTLANAGDRFLKTRSSSETINSVGGTGAFTIAQANLPNVNFTGSTNTTGDHTHTYDDNTTSASSFPGGATSTVANNGNANFQTDTAGAHSHTFSFSTGGNATAINYTPAFIVTNVFIYLGT